MPIQSSFLNRKRIAMMLTLVTLLASVYMLTYSGRIESSDSRGLFDALSSLVQYGDRYLDISAWYNYPPPTASGIYPLFPIDTEPLQPILAAPLFWVAQQVPGIGLNHAVWLFNILICALAGGVLFLYALALGYGETTALLAALLFGLGTIIWPYSKTFFREPLALLMSLLAAVLIERWRFGHYRSLSLLLGIVLALLGAWLSKEAIVFAIPALLILALPAPALNVTHRRLVTLFLGIVILSLIALLLVSILPSPDELTNLRTQIGQATGRGLFATTNLHRALHAYLLSIGGSFWGTSPVVLLAIPGLRILYRRGHYRLVLASVVLLMTFVIGYAVLRGQHWFGGLSWPPRFLIPVIPLLIVGTLPVLDRIVQRIAPRWMVGLLLVLAAYSLWVQLSALLLPWETYTQVLPPEANSLGEWEGGLNAVQYLRWVLLPPLWSQRPLDLAWVRVNVPLWPVAFIMLGIVCGILLYALIQEDAHVKHRSWRTRNRFVIALPVLFLVVTGLSLRAIYRDPFYLGDRNALHAFLPTIASVGQPGDVLLLDSTAYAPFFMNYGKLIYPRVITLSDQPGEQPSPEQPAQVKSDNPDALLLKITPPLIQNLAATRDRLWLMEDAGPWLPWRVRPVERYMAAHYYPIQELSTNPPDTTIRLIEFSTMDAPDPYGFRGPEYLSNLEYGESIRLAGFSLPEGTTYRAGDVLPISLYWGADRTPEQNYTAAWFLANADGSRFVQGTDYQPGWGFAPTSQWQPGVPVWDNRALRLPLDLQPGQYQLWVRLYQSDAPDKLLPVMGGETFDDNTGILPVRIDIAP